MIRKFAVLMTATMLLVLVAPSVMSQPPPEAEELKITPIDLSERPSFVAITTLESLAAAPSGICQELQEYLDCVSSKKADIVFVFDTTGSMGDEISEMKAISTSFADNMESSGIDYRLGLTEFKDYRTTCDGTSCGSSGDFPYRVYNGGVLTSSSAQFKSWINGLSPSGGSDEPESVLAAMMHTVNDQNWRGGDASKIVVVITDAYPHPDGHCCNQEGNTLDGVISALAANGMKVYVVGPDQPSMEELAFETGGKFYLIRSGATLEPILDDITGAISCSFDITGEPYCEDGRLNICVQLRGRSDQLIPYRSGYTDAWMFVKCPDGTSRRYDLVYDSGRNAYCAAVDPVCTGEAGTIEVTVYGRVCEWSSVEVFMVECGQVCPEPCLDVEVLTDQKVYNYGDDFVYRVIVTNNQDEKRRIAISYGYVDPTPETHIIGTFAPDIYPDDTYISLPADFRITEDFYSGKYVFFATATDVYNPECSVSAAKQFWIVERSERQALSLGENEQGAEFLELELAEE